MGSQVGGWNDSLSAALLGRTENYALEVGQVQPAVPSWVGSWDTWPTLGMPACLLGGGGLEVPVCLQHLCLGDSPTCHVGSGGTLVNSN